MSMLEFVSLLTVLILVLLLLLLLKNAVRLKIVCQTLPGQDTPVLVAAMTIWEPGPSMSFVTNAIQVAI